MTWSAISRSLRAAVAARDGEACQYCGLSQQGQNGRFHVDHIYPKSSGGPTRLDNLATQCQTCSVRKSKKTGGIDPYDGSRSPLFHPLRERWADHFEMRNDGTIVGRTIVGRATIAALHMNDELPLDARARQIKAGIISPPGPTPR